MNAAKVGAVVNALLAIAANSDLFAALYSVMATVFLVAALIDETRNRNT